MKIVTCGTRIFLWKRRAEAMYCLASARLFLAEFRYHFLCFKHFGWRRGAVYLLKTPEHCKAIGIALFTHSSHSPNSVDSGS
jgi:hypothetical protein